MGKYNKRQGTDEKPTGHPFEYVGAIHIHSNYSDGLRPIPEIAQIAGEVGIDFLLFADHMTLEPLRAGMERWFGNVLAIIGYEINDQNNKNHYLAYGLSEVLPKSLSAQDYVREVKNRGGIGFIAHPDEKRTAMPAHPPYPWTDWDANGYDGIEIWNHASEWLEKLNNINKYFYILHPLKYLRGPEPETLARWDMLNRQQVMPGIGGLDAHAYPYRWGPLTIYIFHYKILFKGIRTHILVQEKLSEDVSIAKGAVLSALKHARCYMSAFNRGDARGFRFTARSGETVYQMGDTITEHGTEFYVRSPLPGTITLLRDGSPVLSIKGQELIYAATEPGAYRVEVKRRGKPWIYTNHIRLRGDTLHER
jgi:hypothetical protein